MELKKRVWKKNTLFERIMNEVKKAGNFLFKKMGLEEEYEKLKGHPLNFLDVEYKKAKFYDNTSMGKWWRDSVDAGIKKAWSEMVQDRFTVGQETVEMFNPDVKKWSKAAEPEWLKPSNFCLAPKYPVLWFEEDGRYSSSSWSEEDGRQSSNDFGSQLSTGVFVVSSETEEGWLVRGLILMGANQVPGPNQDWAPEFKDRLGVGKIARVGEFLFDLDKGGTPTYWKWAGDETFIEGFDPGVKNPKEMLDHVVYSAVVNFMLTVDIWHRRGEEVEETHDVVADISRKKPCPCGSGKKFKRCCGEGYNRQVPTNYEELLQSVGVINIDPTRKFIKKRCGDDTLSERSYRLARCRSAHWVFYGTFCDPGRGGCGKTIVKNPGQETGYGKIDRVVEEGEACPFCNKTKYFAKNDLLFGKRAGKFWHKSSVVDEAGAIGFADAEYKLVLRGQENG
jgi:hypothetical protein